MLLEENVVVADRFRLVRMIGRGGMGSVWHAVHLALDQPCALKFIDGDVRNVADAHARFEREAKAAAQLRSPHVVQIIDHGVWNGQPYIAMELLEGEDLKKAMASNGGKLPLDSINMIVQQVCRGLTRAHQHGIVHRDLKPDNIFLVNDDDRQVVKVLDFGVAKHTGAHAVDSNTKTGAMIGTPYYMSPEQAQGSKTVDSRSDLWSLAVIVYQCVTGTRPFDSDSLGDLFVKIIVHPIPVPSSVAEVPRGFDQWWAKAAARDPDQRFATAKDFAGALAVCLGFAEEPSVQTDVNALMRTPPLRATAMLQSSPPANPNNFVAPQPVPQAHTAAFVSTPRPASVPPDAMAMAHVAAALSDQHLGGTGNPATLSVVNPPRAVPKKGTHAAIIVAGIGGIALLVVLGTGVSRIARRPSASGAASSEPTTSLSTAVPSATLTASASGAVSAVPPTTADPPMASAAPSASATATSRPVPLRRPVPTAAPTMPDDRKW